MGAVYLPSEFGIIFLPLANVQVKAGDKLRITCRYTHRGKTENVPLYAAIGSTGANGDIPRLVYHAIKECKGDHLELVLGRQPMGSG